MENLLSNFEVTPDEKIITQEFGKRGFDIISNKFFVENIYTIATKYNETKEKLFTSEFDTFAEYYNYLNGEIYDKACYFQYNFSKEEIEQFSINLKHINFEALINFNINNFTFEFSENELKEYKILERKKKGLLKWIDKFDQCSTYEDFLKTITLLNKSAYASMPPLLFISIFLKNQKDTAFDIIMRYINDGHYYDLEKNLCLVCDPQKVLSAYTSSYSSAITAKRHQKKLRRFIEYLDNNELNVKKYSYFDEETHFYVCKIMTDNKKYPSAQYEMYFETFEELAEYLDFDLSFCDLSNAIIDNLDLTKYKISEHTVLPIQYSTVCYNEKKSFDRKEHCFVVEQNWIDKQEKIVKQYFHEFKYFFDFLYFLNNDLSNADLLFCDGLINLTDYTDINLNNAKIRSNISDKIHQTYDTIKYPTLMDCSTALSFENETVFELLAIREDDDFEETYQCQKVYYISDLHLIHRIKNAKCKNINDIYYTIQNIIDCLLDGITNWKNILLIGGDTSTSFFLFELFVKMLRQTLDIKQLDVQVIFTLGNHELWSFKGYKLEDIISKYRQILSDNKMYLLQNSIILKQDWNDIKIIGYEALNSLSRDEIRNLCSRARIMLFGGMAFSGYNERFNADCGLYRGVIDRKDEISETKKFEKLYYKVCSILAEKRVIVLTHTSVNDWCKKFKPQSGFIYVNGHNHRNYFYDDGEYRIYADNQIGYKQNTVRLKYFYLDDDYDIFESYSDGIYEITREQYINFYRGKNIMLQCNREIYKLFMLKKNGYYCFVLQYPNANLCIMDGGRIKSLKENEIEYYYKNMDSVISFIKSPLDKFTDFQKQVSCKIKKIGGSGKIHGSIIDIDFSNHIYVNPIDLTITPYWASDIIYKVVFKDIPSLLETNCPDLFNKYLQIAKQDLIFKTNYENKAAINQAQLYLNTDIYRASREISKMQKIYSNILTIWIEPDRQKLTHDNKQQLTDE